MVMHALWVGNPIGSMGKILLETRVAGIVAHIHRDVGWKEVELPSIISGT
jgi:hypothetical protein